MTSFAFDGKQPTKFVIDRLMPTIFERAPGVQELVADPESPEGDPRPWLFDSEEEAWAALRANSTEEERAPFRCAVVPWKPMSGPAGAAFPFAVMAVDYAGCESEAARCRSAAQAVLLADRLKDEMHADRRKGLSAFGGTYYPLELDDPEHVLTRLSVGLDEVADGDQNYNPRI